MAGLVPATRDHEGCKVTCAVGVTDVRRRKLVVSIATVGVPLWPGQARP